MPSRAGASATTTLTFPNISSRQHVSPALFSRLVKGSDSTASGRLLQSPSGEIRSMKSPPRCTLIVSRARPSAFIGTGAASTTPPPRADATSVVSPLPTVGQSAGRHNPNSLPSRTSTSNASPASTVSGKGDANASRSFCAGWTMCWPSAAVAFSRSASRFASRRHRAAWARHFSRSGPRVSAAARAASSPAAAWRSRAARAKDRLSRILPFSASGGSAASAAVRSASAPAQSCCAAFTAARFLRSTAESCCSIAFVKASMASSCRPALYAARARLAIWATASSIAAMPDCCAGVSIVECES